MLVQFDADERRAEIEQAVAEANRASAPERNRHQARPRPGAQPDRRRHRRAGGRPDGPDEIARRLDGVRPGPAQSRRGPARGTDDPGAFRRPRRHPLGVARRLYFSRNPHHLARRPVEGPSRFRGARKPSRPPQAGPDRQRHVGGLSGPRFQGQVATIDHPRRSGHPHRRG